MSRYPDAQRLDVRISSHIHTNPVWISGRALDIRISTLWISGYPDILTNPDKSRLVGWLVLEFKKSSIGVGSKFYHYPLTRLVVEV